MDKSKDHFINIEGRNDDVMKQLNELSQEHDYVEIAHASISADVRKPNNMLVIAVYSDYTKKELTPKGEN